MLITSGDLAADRRYAYAQDLLGRKDFTAAADLFRQALEIASGWAPAWFGLGEACEGAGDAAGAIVAYGNALRLAPEDRLGAAPRLARLGAGEPRMTPAYVAALFDQYAPRFDEHLTGALDYRGPAIVIGALEAAAPGRRFAAAIDLGCGTGLMAVALQGRAEAIDGVDLSPAMVEKAKERAVYRDLRVGDMVEALSGQPAAPQGGGQGRYDLALAADVLVYVGDLAPLFRAVAEVLRPDGLFAFTVQSHADEGFALGDDLRFRHAATYIRAMADDARFETLHLSDCATRNDGGRPVASHVAVLARRHG
jgi:predicted TPR repeat methyltransferase